MIQDILAVVAAIIPGLLICWYIYQMDKYEKESRIQLIFNFVIGMGLTFPVMLIESKMSGWVIGGYTRLSVILFISFIVVALVEELVKYLALMLYPYPRRFFNEPMDGIVYAVMIGMGFATVENILYATRDGLATTLIRAFTAVPAHAAFAIMMGYFVGRAKFTFLPNRKYIMLALGLGLPWLVHGLYDVFIIQEAYEQLIALALVVLILSIFFARRLMLEQQENSPFK